jgi:hypothetical protein
MRASFAAELATMERHIGELLEDVRVEEIRGPVTPGLVSTVLAAVEGTMLIWAIAPRGDIKERVHQAVEVALGRATSGDAVPQAGRGRVLRSPPSRR